MTQKVLVTGGAGFIGSNFVRFVLQHRPGWRVVNLDLLTYSGNLENLADVEQHADHHFVHGDICDAALLDRHLPGCDAIVHFAAESHVDRSIIDSTPFVRTNVLGTQTLLDAARRHAVRRFVHVSTDEVYGALPLDKPEIKFTETTPIAANSPYSASKAASDLMVRAYHETHGMDVCITRCSNNFGPFQFPEKLIPLFTTNLMEGRKVPVYGDGLNVRDWIHVVDHCEAVLCVLEKGRSGEVYNIGADNEWSNLDLTHMILGIMGKDNASIQYVKDRPGHDRRYAMDSRKIERELGWKATRSAFPEAMEQTIRWYMNNTRWWQRIKSGVYRDVVEKLYAPALGSPGTPGSSPAVAV